MSVDTGSLFGIFAFIISSAGVIYTAVNHKRFRLKCCGKDLDVSVDVEDTDTHEKKRTKTLITQFKLLSKQKYSYRMQLKMKIVY